MNAGLIARASVTIAAPPADVWEALVTPAAIKAYMFGATVTSDWVLGSPIVWIGECQGRAYEDKGIILRIVAERVLEFSYFSPLAGVADLPENYHIVTVHLSSDGAQQTRVLLHQDNNLTEEARACAPRNQRYLQGEVAPGSSSTRSEAPRAGLARSMLKLARWSKPPHSAPPWHHSASKDGAGLRGSRLSRSLVPGWRERHRATPTE